MKKKMNSETYAKQSLNNKSINIIKGMLRPVKNRGTIGVSAKDNIIIPLV